MTAAARAADDTLPRTPAGAIDWPAIHAEHAARVAASPAAKAIEATVDRLLAAGITPERLELAAFVCGDWCGR